jgi:hypothetical protein
MPIEQTNKFICDECEFTTSTTQEVEDYDDPLVVSPKGWGLDPDESGEEPFLCSICLRKATEVYEAKRDKK